jgi:organic hydroperoxide reductase OsmC/OhrA
MWWHIMTESKEQRKEGKVQEITAKITLSLQHDLAFLANFDIPELPSLMTDEPASTGGANEGPNASRLLAVAVGNCLSSSLAFCLKRAKIELESLRTDVEVRITRNEKGYLRVKQMKVDLHPEFASPDDLKKSEKCRQVFQDYCIVTESVRKGIPVEVAFK